MEKERRTKALLLSTLVVVVATVSIAFAAMSRTLNINGIGKMDTASWSVYFDNLSSAKITRGAEEVGKPSISADKGTVQDINVKLSNPKDEISYTVDIVNDGTIDAEITMIKDVELTDLQKKVFEFKVAYTDTGEVLQNGDLLPKKTTKNITIKIKFKDDITEADLPLEAQTINLSYQITYTQYDGGNIPIIPDGGDITTGKAVLAAVANPEAIMEEDVSEPFFNCTSITRDVVESINFVNNINVPTEAKSTVWDASDAGDNSIIGWYQDTDSNDLYEVYIGSEVNIYAPENSAGLFGLFIELRELNLNNFNTSDVTNMNYMFMLCASLSTLDISSFDTSNVTVMSWMFFYCQTLTNLDLSSFNTSNVTDMSYMFYDCSSLTSLDLKNFDVSEVTNMEAMFTDDTENSKLQSINLIGWNTKNVENMYNMFHGCSSLETLSLNSFDTSRVTLMGEMFYDCSSLTSLNLSNFDTSNVINMLSMFRGCSSLTSLDLSNFITSNVTSMENMFSECSSLTSLDLSSFDTTNVTYMNYMFSDCSSLTILDLSSFDTTNVTSMNNMFFSCSSLTSLDLSSFDTTKVTNMFEMFAQCSSLTNLDLSSFNTSNVTGMSNMFNSCTALTSLDLRNADFSNVYLYNTMFISVDSNVQIIVKDETQRTWLTSKFPELTNVVLPSEL